MSTWMTYSIVKMQPEKQNRWHCSRIRDVGGACWNKASYYLVVKPDRARKRSYRRCEECARVEAASHVISMPKEDRA